MSINTIARSTRGEVPRCEGQRRGSKWGVTASAVDSGVLCSMEFPSRLAYLCVKMRYGVTSEQSCKKTDSTQQTLLSSAEVGGKNPLLFKGCWKPFAEDWEFPQFGGSVRPRVGLSE